MSTPDPSPDPIALSEQKIWDLPTRVFHWLLVLCFAGAWLTAESERTQLLHLTLGYCAAALVLWRLLWGVAGSRYALFSDFVRSPAAALRYLRAYLPGSSLEAPRRYLGHNPAGGWAVLGLLALMEAVVLSGWWAYQSGAPDMAGEMHEVLTHALLILIGLHVLAVVATGFMHGENLVRAMWTGRKRALPEQGIRSSQVLIGLLLFAAVTWLGWALYSGRLPGLTS
jgi:cytochrome b